MEENNNKNINFLPNGSKKSKGHSKTRVEKDDYELDMVRPDSNKLKKVKSISMSGSDISFFEKISIWLGSKFKFQKKKEEEKPRIQELQELVGSSQHVGEVMINDEEVLPDEEREEVTKKETKETKEKEEQKVNIKDSIEKDDKDKIIFITKEDHEKELLREKDRTDKIVEENKNVAKPVDVPLHPNKDVKNKDVKISKQDDGILNIPQSLEEVSLSDSIEEKNEPKEEEMKISFDEPEDNKKKSSLWGKIKAFFSGIFPAKDSKHDENESQDEIGKTELPPSIELAQFASQQEEKNKETAHEVTTPVKDFASGVKIMEQEPEESKEVSGPTLEEEPAPFLQNKIQGQGKEELSKAQEDLFSAPPEQPKELEDIFAPVDESKEQIEEPTLVVEEEKVSMWGKIKAFFSGLFSPKAKEIKEVPEQQLTEQKEEIEEPEIDLELSDEKNNEDELNLDKPLEVLKTEKIATAEEVPEVDIKLDQIEEAPIKTEEVLTETPKESIKDMVEGTAESLPKSLTAPELEEVPIVDDSLQEKKQEMPIEQELGKEKSFFRRIKDFFKKLFNPKAKEINLEEEKENINLEGLQETTSEELPVEDQATEGASEELTLTEEAQSNETVVDYKLHDKEEVPEPVKEELSSKFHQPAISTVSRIIDEEGGVDLIPIAIKTKSWGQIAQLFIAAMVGSVVIILSFYATLYFQQVSLEKAKEEQQNKLSDLEQKIIEYEGLNDEIDVLGQELVLVNDMLNKHIYWTNLFTLIEKYTLEDVYLAGFSAGAGGALSFSATGSGYDAAARQLKLLQSEEAKEFVQSVVINSVSGGESEVRFSINLILNDELFYYSQ